MSFPRLARPIRTLVALIAAFMTVFALTPTAHAAKPQCSYTKKHPTCVTSITTQWVTDTAAKVLVSTDVKTTMRLDYQPAYYGGIKSVQDNVRSRDHSFTITGLMPGHLQFVDAYATAKDGSTGSLGSQFDTMHRKMTIRVDKMVIDDDGDNLNDGEVHAALRLESSPGDVNDGQIIFSTQQVHSGQVLEPKVTFTYWDRPISDSLRVGTTDVDDEECGNSWTNSSFIYQVGMTSICGDTASAQATITRDFWSGPRHLVMAGTGGMAFHAYLTVTDALVN